jgi:hypothetical protein
LTLETKTGSFSMPNQFKLCASWKVCDQHIEPHMLQD